jgi:hypothetical protein
MFFGALVCFPCVVCSSSLFGEFGKNLMNDLGTERCKQKDRSTNVQKKCTENIELHIAKNIGMSLTADNPVCGAFPIAVPGIASCCNKGASVIH